MTAPVPSWLRAWLRGAMRGVWTFGRDGRVTSPVGAVPAALVFDEDQLGAVRAYLRDAGASVLRVEVTA